MDIIKVLIADDQTLMRDGLKTILELEEGMEVVGVAENGIQAYELAEKLNPDVVLMDIRMPIMDGVDSTRIIKNNNPSIVVIMLTTFDDDEYIIQALQYGASGYLLKDIQGNKLIQAIRESMAGNLLMPSNIAVKLATRLSKISEKESINIKSNNLALSYREQEIATLMIKGYTNKQIASELCISEGTAKNYISMIYSKIGINDRTKAVIFLRECL
ncbi:response regulator transcription factor [Ruminiclostridium herbifermentans]|uniref:Stage 0 sporulation protein A homolog n=1 Tax=Ruminiclostridium herbifermentans TaxID=2488810 RepID=A0A4V6ENS4_9FIRM|nr:response regulator transcription factor [Ruminiclostridium herbifermentans]QNU67339.1 response regulator transcription factor [Ruminiclostridium herbifermentans]